MIMNNGDNEHIKPTILIADDDPSTRILLRATITQWDYPVLEASDGEEAWDILNGENSPQIATVDWMMPKIDGLSLCQRTKNLKKPPYMILITSMSGPTNLVHALESGADDFISKPFNYVELRSRLFVGERIINFRNKLEIIISKQKQGPAYIDKKYSEIMQKIEVLHKKLQEEFALLQQMILICEGYKSEQRLAVNHKMEQILVLQQHIVTEINNGKNLTG